jgi:lipoyl(octanoyl) transferase
VRNSMRNCACSSERLRERLTGLEWRLMEDGPGSGTWNMAVDEAMLEAARRDAAPPTLRLYRWRQPTLSLGRHQDPAEGIDHAFRRRQSIDLVRRPTGGRAVLHDQEVTYSIVLPAALGRGAGVGEVYGVLAGAIHAGIGEALGIRCSVWGIRPDQTDRTGRSAPIANTASCFGSAAGGDGVVEAGKLVGSAQARRGGAVLQHGSLLLAIRRAAWRGLFGTNGMEVALADLGMPATGEKTVREALRHGLEGYLQARWAPGKLSPIERSEAERLMAERYGVGCLD